MLLRPWFDAAALRLLTQWYFPLSRGWAAALAAGGSVEPLPERDAVRPLRPPPAAVDADAGGDRRAVARCRRRRVGGGVLRRRPGARRRRGAATAARRLALTNLRASFVPLHLQIAAAADRVGGRGARIGGASAWLAPSLPAAGVRRRFRSLPTSRPRAASFRRLGIEGWVRFPAPTAAVTGLAWARVSAPVVAAQRRLAGRCRR